MPELDGLAMLRDIGDHPEEFAEIDTAVAKAARELIVKQSQIQIADREDARVTGAARRPRGA